MGYTDIVDPIPPSATISRRTVKLRQDNVPVTKLPILRGETDPARGFTNVDIALRDFSSRLTALEKAAMAAGVTPIIATMAREVDPDDNRHDDVQGALVGYFVHVAPDGTARLAVNTDENLWANAVVTLPLGAGKAQCYSVGSWPARCKPLTGELSGRMFLSNLPGFAQDSEPTAAGSLRQELGSRLTERDGQGKCLIDISFGEYVLL